MTSNTVQYSDLTTVAKLSEDQLATAATGDKIVSKFAAQVAGKTILITGPSEGGIGAQTAIFLAAANPKTLIFAGRSKVKIQPVIDLIKAQHPNVLVTFVALDLRSLDSVRVAAKEINNSVEKLDIVINNAGVMAVEKYTSTADGIESQFAINHLGHFLLTNLLMGKILTAGRDARIVNVTSLTYIVSGIRNDWNFEGGDYNPWVAYAQSKSANILFSSALARKLKDNGVFSFAVNPGFVPGTKLQVEISPESFADGYAITMKALNGVPIEMVPKTTEEATSTILCAALDPSLSTHSGAVLSDCIVYPEQLREHATGEANEDKLWSLSEGLVGEKFNL